MSVIDDSIIIDNGFVLSYIITYDDSIAEESDYNEMVLKYSTTSM